LQHWQFTGETKNFQEQLRQFIDHALPQELQAARAGIESELRDILSGFFQSNAYAELKHASILGREVALLMPWNGRIMEGVIDLIYQRNGLLYLADYKTDRIKPSQLKQGVERYRQQAEIYIQATEKSLQRRVAAFKLIFLRPGEAIEVGTKPNEELTLF
jgi:ATP-dependent exoDNAse (exonuclease V) beta subunit